MHRASKSALTSTKWLYNIIDSKVPSIASFKILDASWHLPSTGRNARQEYKEKHIPGAQFFDIDECADNSSGLDHMIPQTSVFEEYVGNLGIDNDTHVVVYDNNPQFGIFSAQRVWWTFRIFGHDNISILEGGLPKWISENKPVSSEQITVKAQKFNASFLPHLVKSMSDVEDNIRTSEYLLVDARPSGRFKGEAPEPREGESKCQVLRLIR